MFWSVYNLVNDLELLLPLPLLHQFQSIGRDHFKQYVSTPSSVALYFDSPQTPAFKTISTFTSINKKSSYIHNNTCGTNEVVEKRDESPTTTSSFPTTTDTKSFYTPTATGANNNNDTIEETGLITFAPQDLMHKKIKTNSGSIDKDAPRTYITTIKINPLSLNLTGLENSQVIVKTPGIASDEEKKIELVFDRRQKETIVILTSDGIAHSPASISLESIPSNTQQHTGATTTNTSTFRPTSFSTSSPSGHIPSISSLLSPINGYTNTPQSAYAPPSPRLSDDEVDESIFDKDDHIDEDEDGWMDEDMRIRG